MKILLGFMVFLKHRLTEKPKVCLSKRHAARLIIPVKLQADSEIAEIVWLTDDIGNVSPVDKLIFADLYEKGITI